MSSFFVIVVFVVAIQVFAWRKPKRRLPRGRDFDAAVAAFDPATYVEQTPAFPDNDDDDDSPVWAPPATTLVAPEPSPPQSDFAANVMRLAYAPGVCSPRPGPPVLSPRQE